MARMKNATVCSLAIVVVACVLATRWLAEKHVREGMAPSTTDDGSDPTKWTKGVTGKKAQCQAAATYFGIVGGGDWGCAPEKWRQDATPNGVCTKPGTGQWTGKAGCSWWSETCSYDPTLPEPYSNATVRYDASSPDYQAGCKKQAAAPPEEQCCQHWVQTLSCKGHGPIDTGSDYLKKFGTTKYDCNRVINSGSSGYCVCKDGTKLAYSDCGHAPFTCQDACAKNCTAAPPPPKGCVLPPSLGVKVEPGQTEPCAASAHLGSGSTCNVQCAQGYESNEGTSQYACDNGDLRNATLKCSAKGCTLPSSLGTGVLGGDDKPCVASGKLTSGQSCAVKCDKGFKSNGGTTEYSCNEGNLKSATLKCAPISCTIPDQFGLGVEGEGHNACMNGAPLKAGESCGVGCRTGYKSTGGSTSYQCGETGELANASLKCERIACPLPTGFGKGKTWGGAAPCEEGGQLLSGQHCTIKCASGYHTGGGSPVFSCSENGALQDASLMCTPNTCKLPQKFGAGKVTGGTNPCQNGGLLDAGGDCTIQCEPGYKPVSGTPDYSCDQGGHLKPPTLDCQPVSCTIPTDFGPGVTGTGETPCIPGSQLKAGSSCAIACAPTYEMVGGEQTLAGTEGVAEFSCSNSGFLTEPELKCRQDHVVAYNAVWAIDLGGIRN